MAREPDHIAAYRKAAEDGESSAQFSLGEAYRLGLKVARDPAEAVRWLHKAAIQGHPQAGRSLQQMQAQGIDITPPADQPITAHRQSLDDLLDSLKPADGPEGDGGMDAPLVAPAADADPLDLESGPRMDLLALRHSDDPAAWVALGNAYRLGHGIDQDEVEAFSWYSRAAKAGNVQGQFNLALLYDQGLGVRANDTEALRWYLAAAKAGDGQAQFNLANMICLGRGCPADAKLAEQWYRKAAAQGEAFALYNLGTLYESGQGMEVNSAMAEDFYRQAAAKGVAEAQFNLGNLLRGRDVEAALDFYTQASEQGLRQAQLNLGLMLQDSDAASAAYWLRRAAKAGDTVAMLNLAALLITGRGVAKDEGEAYLWLEQAGRVGRGAVADIAAKGVRALAKVMGEDSIAQARGRALLLGLGG